MDMERSCDYSDLVSPLMCPGGGWTWVMWEARGLYGTVSGWEGVVAVRDKAWTCRTF